MKILAFDTTTEACSAALSIAGEVRERFTIAPRQHTELILPMLDALLADAELLPTQLDALAFGRGPGSFTGLRIACGVAQGIAFAADIPVIPVSSLATLAQAAFIEQSAHQVLAVLDARMHEVYWGFYVADSQGIMRLSGEEQVGPLSAIQVPTPDLWYSVGTGWLSYAAELREHLGDAVQTCPGNNYPTARAMIPLALAALREGATVSADQALPVYLRNRIV